jgi:hypothetical protein
MAGSPHTASELFELAALFRRSAENTDQDEIREKLRNAATEIETRARMIAAESARSQESAVRNPFSPVDFLT